MAHSDSYTEASPTDSTLATSIDDEIVKSRRMLRERFAVDHKISSSDDATDVYGVHTQVTFEARIATPTEPTNSIATFYLKTGDYDCEIRFTDERDVDNKIVIIGEVKLLMGSSVPGGWLALDGSTLGNAASGADYAGDDYQDLFYWLYAELADAQAPVSGGRTTVGPDWTANKTLTMPDARSRVPLGAGTGDGLSARTIGATDGDETKDLSHNHSHDHTMAHTGASDYIATSPTIVVNNADPGGVVVYAGSAGSGASAMYGKTITDATSGGSATQDVMNPWFAVTYIIKY